MARPVVLYHGPECSDGFGAAFCSWLKFRESATYIPVNYGQPVPDLGGPGCDLYILDFSYPKQTLLHLIDEDQPASITILDHHASAQKELEGLVKSDNVMLTIKFDMAKSGARLAWEYFWPNTVVPGLILQVESRELWKFDLPDSREINAAIASYEKKFKLWQGWYEGWYRYADSLADEGEAILRYQGQMVKMICQHASEVVVDGNKIPVVNTPLLQSEVAGELAKGKAFAAVWYLAEDGKERWSFRSDENGIDVSEMAKRVGGGGHPHASGCNIVAGGPGPIMMEYRLNGGV